MRRGDRVTDDRSVLGLRDAGLHPGELGPAAGAAAGAAVRGLPVLPGCVVTLDAVARLVGSPAESGAVLTLIRTSLIAFRRQAYESVRITQSWAGAQTGAPARSVVLPLDNGAAIGRELLGLAADGRLLFGSSPRPQLVLLIQATPATAATGVAFARDPWTGRRRRAVVTREEPPLRGRALRRVERLCRRAGRAYGAAQVIDWLVDADGRAWLTSSRGQVTWTGPATRPRPAT